MWPFDNPYREQLAQEILNTSHRIDALNLEIKRIKENRDNLFEEYCKQRRHIIVQDKAIIKLNEENKLLKSLLTMSNELCDILLSPDKEGVQG